MSEEDEMRQFFAEAAKEAHAMAETLMVPRKPGGPRGHHFLPQFLLRRFADDDDQILTVDLSRTAEIRVNHVSDTAKIKDYHTIDQPEIGPSNAIESIRSSVENLAAPAVQRVATGFLPASQPDRFAIAMWAAQMYCFSPPVRRLMEVTADQITKIGLEGRPGIMPSSEYEVVLPQNNQLQLGLQVAQHATGILRQMRLAVVKYSTPGVAIGDCPLWMHSSADAPTTIDVGFANAEEIRLPVDRKTLLVFHRDDELGEQTLWNVDERPELLGRAMAHETSRNLYCNPEDRHLYEDLAGSAKDRPIISKSAHSHAGDGVGEAPERIIPRRFSASRGRNPDQ